MQETMLQNRKPVIRSYWLVGACIAVGFVASICIGNYPISVREIISILTGGEVSALTRKVFFTLRLPRTCMAAPPLPFQRYKHRHLLPPSEPTGRLHPQGS